MKKTAAIKAAPDFTAVMAALIQEANRTAARPNFGEIEDRFYDAIEAIDCIASILGNDKEHYLNPQQLYCLLNPHREALREFGEAFDEWKKQQRQGGESPEVEK